MKARKLALALIGTLLFAWGCGDDDPVKVKDDGNGNGKATSQPWTTAGGDFNAAASATANVADVGVYSWTGASAAPMWAAPGGDYNAVVTATADVAGEGMYRWGSSVGMVADVQTWVDNPASDFGWLIKGNESTISAKRFDTKDHLVAANRPKLTVYHDGLPAPVEIDAVRDNTLYEDLQGDRSNGAGQYMFAGKTAEPSESLRRALVAFDVAAALAPGVAIDSVFLDLNMSKTDGHPQAFTIALHRVLANWGEGASAAGRGEGAGAPAEAGDATWLHRFNEITNPGMAADVQSWLTTPATNFGWLLKGDETTVSAKRFDTKDNETAPNRPRLMVYHDGLPDAANLPSARDNTLFEDTGTLNRSNGAGEYMFAGKTKEGSDDLRRGLILFDIAQVLGGVATTIDSVVLELNMSKTDGHEEAYAVSLHKVLADWGEAGSMAGLGEGGGAPADSGDATWRFRIFVPAE